MTSLEKKTKHPGESYLLERTISPSASKKAGYALLSPAETKRLCGFEVHAIGIPLLDIAGKKRTNGAAGFAVRLLPQPGFGGVVRDMPKFVTEKDRHNAAAFPPGPNWLKVAKDTKTTLTATEGPIKAYVLCRAGFPAIGLNGVYGFRAKIHGRSVFLPDLDRIEWSGRRVEAPIDSDYDDNPDVRRALAQFATEMSKRGAELYRVVIPSAPDGAKQGVDDFIKRHSVEAYRKLPRVRVLDEELTQRTYTLDELLADAVYIASTDTITLLSNTALDCTATHFKRLLASSKEKIGDKNCSVANLWLEDVRRRTVHGRTFAPGAGQICEDPNGLPAINTYREIEHIAPRAWRQQVKPFLDHLNYLIPEKDDRRQFLLWLAHLIQQPGEMPPWHVIMFTDGAQGIGRNLLAAEVGHVVQPYAALHVDISALAGTVHGTGFNGVISRKVFACVDELHASAFAHGARRMMETLKSNLTAEQRLINPKYGAQSIEFNRTRVLILSNHVGAMPLDTDDRRFLVIQNPNKPKPPSYYTAHYERLADPGYIASIWRYLKEQDLSNLHIGRAPMSAAKHSLIEAAEPTFVTKVRELIEDYEKDLITSTAVTRRADLATWELREAMHALGCIKYPKKVRLTKRIGGTERAHIWILKNHESWLRAAPDKVAKHLDESQPLNEKGRDDA